MCCVGGGGEVDASNILTCVLNADAQYFKDNYRLVDGRKNHLT